MLALLSLNLINLLPQQSSTSGLKRSVTLRFCLWTLIEKFDLDFSSPLSMRMASGNKFCKAASLNTKSNMSDTLTGLFEPSFTAPSTESSSFWKK